MRIKTLIISLTAAVTLCGGVTACGSDTQGPGHPKANATEQGHGKPVGEPEPGELEEAESPPEMDLTKESVEVVWEATTAADKKSMCDGLDLFGPDWAAQQMENGAATDAYLVDWDRAVDIIGAKCDAEGL